MSKHIRVNCTGKPGPDPEPPPVRPIRTIELHTFPRLNEYEMAALFGLQFAGYVS